ncbi:MAG TPA: NAD(P)-dependent oxidoreductase [Solirubrobacteraceae bacterium]|nr:NAD(P)-dependent oxidoreductase [Solirubrobacteraceae bacterium]
MATQRVGFIGLGIMGSRMAANLRRAGFELSVFNRTRERADAWAAEHGGTVADSPRAAAEGADVVITMVVDGAQVEAMLLGTDGAAEGAPEGALFVDMSTIAPADARRLADVLRERGHGFIDAPVTGSSPKAEAGTLTIMAGGADEDMRRAQPLFEAMGETLVHAGEVGQGQRVKVLSNAVSAVNCATIAQALVVGRREGVDLDALVEVMRSGSAGSTMLELKARPMLTHDFDPLFKLEHMLKDVRLCLEEARLAGAGFPFAGLAGELYSAGMGRGLGEQDFAAVLEVIEGLNDTRV